MPAAPPSTAAVQVAPPLSEVVDGISRRAAKLRQGNWRFDVEIRNGESGPPGLAFQLSVTRSGELIRYATTRPSEVKTRLIHFTAAWNGKVQTELIDIPSNPPDRRYEGHILPGSEADLGLRYWPTVIELQMLDTHRTLAELLTLGKWEVIGTRTIGGYSAVGVRNVAPLGASLQGYTVEAWVAPDRGYAPVQIEVTIEYDAVRAHDGTNLLTNVRLEEIDDLWVISQADVVITNPNARANEFGTHSQITRFHATAPFSPDAESSPEFYRLKFPVGAQVIDNVTQSVFYAGKAVIVELPDKSIRFAPIASFPEHDAWTDYSSTGIAQEWDKSQRAEGIRANWLTLRSDGSVLDYAKSPAPTPDGRSWATRDYAVIVVAIASITVGVYLLRKSKTTKGEVKV